jgi:hypothetical protein
MKIMLLIFTLLCNLTNAQTWVNRNPQEILIDSDINTFVFRCDHANISFITTKRDKPFLIQKSKPNPRIKFSTTTKKTGNKAIKTFTAHSNFNENNEVHYVFNLPKNHTIQNLTLTGFAFVLKSDPNVHIKNWHICGNKIQNSQISGSFDTVSVRLNKILDSTFDWIPKTSTDHLKFIYNLNKHRNFKILVPSNAKTSPVNLPKKLSFHANGYFRKGFKNVLQKKNHA